jgi:hypothetical protein
MRWWLLFVAACAPHVLLVEHWTSPTSEVHNHYKAVPCWRWQDAEPLWPIEEWEDQPDDKRKHPVIVCGGLDDIECERIRSATWSEYGKTAHFNWKWNADRCRENEDEP